MTTIDKKGFGHSYSILHLKLRAIEYPITVIKQLNKLGFNCLIVGGAVRDAILGLKPKDVDIEVYGIDYSSLESILADFGRTDIVGKSFGVIKFKDQFNNEFDFSIPRRESKIGVGHTAFNVSFDKSMTPKDAAERRDFTFNALAYDPITQQLHDYFGGVEDLNNGIIRATSDKFSEDPLRILRAMQFQARTGFSIAPETMATMKQMVSSGALNELPIERISEEWMKWAIKGTHQSMIFDFIHNTGIELPFIKVLRGVPQDKIWHPEGDVEIHTKHVIDAAVEIAEREKLEGDEKVILIFAALCHDFAKPDTTALNIVDGRQAITARGHEKMGGGHAEKFLKAIGIKQSIIDAVVCLVENHLEHVNIAAIDNEKGRLKSVRKLAVRLKHASINQMLLLIEADASGRPPLPKGLSEKGQLLKELSLKAGVSQKAEKPIIMGRHLIELGLTPSVKFTTILNAAKEAQDEGDFTDIDGGMAWLNNFIEKL